MTPNIKVEKARNHAVEEFFSVLPKRFHITHNELYNKGSLNFFLYFCLFCFLFVCLFGVCRLGLTPFLLSCYLLRQKRVTFSLREVL